MSQAGPKLRRVENGFAHWCPGCEEMHVLPDGWSFDGDTLAPTFFPSFRHSGTKRVFKEGSWTGEWVLDDAGRPARYVCHYILTKGVLNFCSDSSHALSGRSVNLPDLPSGYTDG